MKNPPAKTKVPKRDITRKVGTLDHRKQAMLTALERTLGIVSPAAKMAKIARKTHYEWMATDPEYKAACESIAEMTIDFAESKLHTQIADGNVIATIFYLKCKAKARGYVERTEFEISDKTIAIEEVRTYQPSANAIPVIAQADSGNRVP